jgi:hypothetical protein
MVWPGLDLNLEPSFCDPARNSLAGPRHAKRKLAFPYVGRRDQFALRYRGLVFGSCRAHRRRRFRASTSRLSTEMAEEKARSERNRRLQRQIFSGQNSAPARETPSNCCASHNTAPRARGHTHYQLAHDRGTGMEHFDRYPPNLPPSIVADAEASQLVHRSTAQRCPSSYGHIHAQAAADTETGEEQNKVADRPPLQYGFMDFDPSRCTRASWCLRSSPGICR